MNQIKHFDGDNDHVDEEFESSNEKSPSEEFSKSDQKGFTPGCDLASARSDNRIFSDLSSKVVNINNASEINWNPFTSLA